MKKITLSIVSLALLFILVSCSSKAVVTFDSNGGTKCDSIEVTVGETITLPKEPTKEGYIFKGWYLDGVEFNFSSAINSNITLKAKWEEILEVYTIEYEIGASANMSSNAPTSFKEGKGSEVQLPKPTKSGYIFTGWYENETLVTSLTENRNYKLVAKWEVADTFEVVFKVEGVVYETLSAVEGETLKDVTLPEDPTKEDYEFLGWYLEDVKYDFNNTIITGDLELVAKFKQVKKVVAYAVNTPTNILSYNANKGDKNGDGNSKDDRNEFFVWNESYLVGDDNNWTFKPNVTFYKFNLNEDGSLNPSNFQEVVPTTWEYEIVIYQYNEATSEYDILVDNEDKTVIDSVNYNTCQIDFAEGVANVERAYLVKVNPKGLTTNQEANKDKYTIAINIEVVDGYNVYDAKELGYINNRSDEYKTPWDEFKAANGLNVNYVANRIILHTDIKVTTADFPAAFLYSKEEAKGQKDEIRYYDPSGLNIPVTLEGSLKDIRDSGIYHRVLNQNEELIISGNYFQISAAEIPFVVREDKADNAITPLGEVVSHASLIKVDGANNSNVVMENLNFIGNANRSEIAIKGGGIILSKFTSTQATIKNNISSKFFITYMPELSDKLVLIENCKVYDSFNSFVYNWGHSNVHIKDSEMIGAGGPGIIQDHVKPASDGTGGNQGGITIENSKIEAYVAGTEGWFTIMQATAVVPAIKSLNALFTPFGRSFLKNNEASGETYLNIVIVNKSGNAQSITAEKISGRTTIIDETKSINHTFDFGANNPYLKAMLDLTFAQGAPSFETTAGGYAYTNGSMLLDVQNNNLSTAEQYANAIYQGDYLCIYYSGMAIVLGYYNAGDVYTA